MKCSASNFSPEFSLARAAQTERRIARVMAAAGKPLTVGEIAEAAKLARATCFKRLKALEERELAGEVSEKRPPKGKGHDGVRWVLLEGALQELEFEKSQEKIRVQQLGAQPFRHPQDVALFGEYRRAA